MSKYIPQEIHERLKEITKYLDDGEFLAAFMAVACAREKISQTGTLGVSARIESLESVGLPGAMKIDEVTLSFEPDVEADHKRTHFDA